MKSPFITVADELNESWRKGNRGQALNIMDLIWALREIDRLQNLPPKIVTADLSNHRREEVAPVMATSNLPLWERFKDWFDARNLGGSISHGEIPLLTEVTEMLRSCQEMKDTKKPKSR
jgi:hypothetical protein